jgi:hypothetical protein
MSFWRKNMIWGREKGEMYEKKEEKERKGRKGKDKKMGSKSKIGKN